MQASICDEVGIGAHHFQEISAPNGRYQLICNDLKQITWLRTLLRCHKLTEFPSSKHLDKQSNVLHSSLEHPWARLFVQIYSKQPQLKVFPLPHGGDVADDQLLSNDNEIPATYSQALAYVTSTNFKNLWEAAYKRYQKSHVKFCKQGAASNHVSNHEHRDCHLLPYDIVLKELLQRIFQCPILHCKSDRLRADELIEGDNEIYTTTTSTAVAGDISSNLLPAFAVIETSTHFCVFFYPPFINTTIYDCITYSPAVLGKSYNKSLFIIYQICQMSKKLQSAGLFLGDVRLHDIFLRENLWLQILPHIDTNMLIQPHVQFINSPSDIIERTPSLDNNAAECLNTTTCADVCDPANTKFDLKFAYDLDQFSLREYCEMWCSGQLSNFDYLTILNNAAGRSLKDPAHYHVMPWVTDFSARNGASWRDLTKSKYRLNKGDAHLDLMYTGTSNTGAGGGSNCAECPHHVSDFLSEITYFVYMARRTPQKILCEHVRPIWVPAEYPVSIQRLQAWTPDECIPEFYSDPLIFKSIHEDLQDLELPTWASCPEDFICKHREALESQYVSERLQHWIDLNFGYKLTGKAAVKSKNVCLSMVDQHRNLTQRGIVQLFTQPHPPKRFPLPWFTKTAPRLSQLFNNNLASPNVKSSSVRSRSSKQTAAANENATTKRLAKSTENLHTATMSSQQQSSTNSSPRLRTDRCQSRSNNAAAATNANTKDERETAATSNSNFYATTNLIELPKDFNPSALIQSLEMQQSFFARTFPMQKPAANALEKIITNDLMFEENSEEHSYTNQLFAASDDVVAASAGDSINKTKSKNLLAPCLNSIKKQTLQNLLQERRARELQVIGCLIVELFLLHRLRPLLMNGASANFEERLNACRIVANQYRLELPKCVRYTVKLLLLSHLENTTQIVTEKGLPLPSAAQLLEPIFVNALLPFPNNYYPTYGLIRSLHAFKIDASLLELHTHFNCNGKECGRYAEVDRARVLFSRKIAECKLMSCCAQIGRLLDPIAYEQFPSIELLLPHFIELLNNEQTSILAAWNLFDPVAQALGIKQTQKYFLLPLMKLYDVECFERGMHSLRARSTVDHALAVSSQVRFSISSSFKSRKSVKLYHHSFLLHLIVRFGLRCFLQNFITPLIEAVGGFKEPEEGSGFHYHSGSFDDPRRTSKILGYVSDEQNPESTTTTTIMQESGDATISSDETVGLQKEEIEEVFTFEDDANSSDFISNSGTGENKSLDSFDMRPATAEEAKETTPEKLSINEIIYSGSVSNASFDDSNAESNSEEKTSSGGGGANEENEGVVRIAGPQSPTIAIPTINIFHRNYHLNTIDCEIGSRKSVDSFEILTQAAAEEEVQKVRSRSGTLTANANPTAQPTPLQNEQESQDSLQASVISKMSEAKQAQNNRIAEMSAESLVWLSHRLGPVLTSRYITRNLLKMLSLCYVGQENLLPELTCEPLSPSDSTGNLNYFSIADARVIGDRSATRVLECLVSIAALFGEQIILLQYFPHISELIATGTKRLTSSLEGAIISSLQLLKYLVPCLTDVTLMERMRETIVESILLPIVRLLASTRLCMPNGYLGRSVLARKLLDAIYALSVRIGSDMSKEHLCIPVLRQFFLIFDKVYGNMEHFDKNQQFANNQSITPPPETTINSRETEELRDVFNPALAHIAYLSFLRFLGESIMRRTLLNFEFILMLCHEFELPDYIQSTSTCLLSGDHQQRGSDALDCPLSKGDGEDKANAQAEISVANSFGTQLIGNRIEVINENQKQTQGQTQTQTTNKQQQLKQSSTLGSMEVLDMVAYKFEHVSNTRHLKGNWLAYWRHEITRADNDAKLNLKQIKLQSFVGHANSVRSIIALDNENSFISASKDKTVKLWSLRSEGDGTKATSCQFTYTAHKKSIISLAYMEAMRFVVSCDAGVHIWDPFIGRPLGVLDSAQKHNPVTVVKCLPSPSPLIVAGTAEATVRMIDSRNMQYVTDWRVASATQSSATVRCLTVAPSGNWLAAGLSNGSIVMLDTRTGLVLNAWRPMECDLLQLAAPNDQQLISSSLDHSLAVWHTADGILHYQLRPPAEPAHYLQTIGAELIFATTGNRIGLYTDLNSSHAAYSVTKLRSETFRGVLTSLAVLPLNHAFLAGNESGNIIMLC